MSAGHRILPALLFALLWLAPYAIGAAKSDYILYVGNYKGKNAAGIYTGRFDAAIRQAGRDQPRGGDDEPVVPRGPPQPPVPVRRQ